MSNHPSTPGNLPDLEDLAAFAEQRLEGSARQAVMDRLASDEEYYEVYVELLRFRDEEAELLAGLEDDVSSAAPMPTPVAAEAPVPGDDVDPSEPVTDTGPIGSEPAGGKLLRPNRWRRWAPVASLAAMLAVAAGLWLLVGSSASFAPSELARGLAPKKGDVGASIGALFRGGSDGSPTILDPWESFLIGAQIMDLQVAEARGDEELLKICRAQLAETAKKDRLLGLYWLGNAEDVTGFTRGLLKKDYADSFYLHYGMWARAVWLAGRAQRHEYLARQDVADWLEQLQSEQVPEEATEADLEELASLLDAGEYGDLVDKVEQIAREYDSDFRTPPADEAY